MVPSGEVLTLWPPSPVPIDRASTVAAAWLLGALSLPAPRHESPRTPPDPRRRLFAMRLTSVVSDVASWERVVASPSSRVLRPTVGVVGESLLSLQTLSILYTLDSAVRREALGSLLQSRSFKTARGPSGSPLAQVSSARALVTAPRGPRERAVFLTRGVTAGLPLSALQRGTRTSWPAWTPSCSRRGFTTRPCRWPPRLVSGPTRAPQPSGLFQAGTVVT